MFSFRRFGIFRYLNMKIVGRLVYRRKKVSVFCIGKFVFFVYNVVKRYDTVV